MLTIAEPQCLACIETCKLRRTECLSSEWLHDDEDRDGGADDQRRDPTRHRSGRDIAGPAATSPRTFARRFRDQTGTTPLQWLITARVRRAQELLETTPLSIDEIATAAGFDGAAALRDRFRRTVGVSPKAYRRSFGAPVEQAATQAPRHFPTAV